MWRGVDPDKHFDNFAKFQHRRDHAPLPPKYPETPQKHSFEALRKFISFNHTLFDVFTVVTRGETIDARLSASSRDIDVTEIYAAIAMAAEDVHFFFAFRAETDEPHAVLAPSWVADLTALQGNLDAQIVDAENLPVAKFALTGKWSDLDGRPSTDIGQALEGHTHRDANGIAPAARSLVLSDAKNWERVVPHRPEHLSAAPAKHKHFAKDVVGLAPVALTGLYADLADAPVPQTPEDLGAASRDHTHHVDELALGLAARTLSFTDLDGIPPIPASPADIGAAPRDHAHDFAELQGIPPVVLSGKYTDLADKPFVPATLEDFKAAPREHTHAAPDDPFWHSGSLRDLQGVPESIFEIGSAAYIDKYPIAEFAYPSALPASGIFDMTSLELPPDSVIPRTRCRGVHRIFF